MNDRSIDIQKTWERTWKVQDVQVYSIHEMRSCDFCLDINLCRDFAVGWHEGFCRRMTCRGFWMIEIHPWKLETRRSISWCTKQRVLSLHQEGEAGYHRFTRKMRYLCNGICNSFPCDLFVFNSELSFKTTTTTTTTTTTLRATHWHFSISLSFCFNNFFMFFFAYGCTAEFPSGFGELQSNHGEFNELDVSSGNLEAVA